MYSSCHQIACGSDLRIAHYSSAWRLMITSECSIRQQSLHPLRR